MRSVIIEADSPGNVALAGTLAAENWTLGPGKVVGYRTAEGVYFGVKGTKTGLYVVQQKGEGEGR